MKLDYIKKSDNITVERHCFDAALSVDCGQSFRWKQVDENGVRGIAFGRGITFYQDAETVTFSNVSEEDFQKKIEISENAGAGHCPAHSWNTKNGRGIAPPLRSGMNITKVPA